MIREPAGYFTLEADPPTIAWAWSRRSARAGSRRGRTDPDEQRARSKREQMHEAAQIRLARARGARGNNGSSYNKR
jgi:hypothetical protein